MDKPKRYIITPNICREYLTPHKSYEILASDNNGYCSIMDNTGDVITVKLKSCPHLYHKPWLEPVNIKPQLSITREQAALNIYCALITDYPYNETQVVAAISQSIELADKLIAKLNEQP